MGFRLQRRIRIAPGIRLNISKRGVGLSAGVPGLTLSAGTHGIRGTASVPGTGLSVSKQFGSQVKRSDTTAVHQPAPTGVEAENLSQLASQLAKQSTWTGWALLCMMTIVVAWVGVIIFLLSFLVPAPASGRRFNAALKDLKRDDSSKAITNLTEALRVKSDNHAARRLLVVVLGELGRYEEAYANIAPLLTMEPEHRPHWVQAVAILCELNRAAEVPSLLARIPPDGEMLAIVSGMLLEAEHCDEVIQIVQKSPCLDDQDYGEALRLNLGRAFFGKEQWEIAAEVLVMGPIATRTRREPIVTEFRYWLGLCYLHMGEKQRAKTQLSKVYAEDVGYREIGTYMAQLAVAVEPE